jgi:hypothetical protein
MTTEDRDLLAREIQSWDSFKYALRKENADLFDQMLKGCQQEEDDKEGVQFANALNAKGESFAAESLFMVLVLQQQRMINRLIDKLSDMKHPVANEKSIESQSLD